MTLHPILSKCIEDFFIISSLNLEVIGSIQMFYVFFGLDLSFQFNTGSARDMSNACIITYFYISGHHLTIANWRQG